MARNTSTLREKGKKMKDGPGDQGGLAKGLNYSSLPKSQGQKFRGPYLARKGEKGIQRKIGSANQVPSSLCPKAD